MLGGITAFADDLADLKAAAKRYVAGGSCCDPDASSIARGIKAVRLRDRWILREIREIIEL
jgi:hypothetical protein